MKTVLGVIDRIVTRREEWFVGLFTPEGEEAPVRVAGVIPGVTPGLTYSLELKDDHHELYGEQFKIVNYSLRKPVNKAGIRSFLETLPGVGVQSARGIVEKFPEDPIGALRDRPLEVAMAVPRFGAGAAGKASAELQMREDTIADELQLRTVLSSCKPSTLKKAKEEWGAKARAIIEDDPYILTMLRGVGFLEADGVARAIGIEGDDPRRIEAGLRHRGNEQRRDGSTLFDLNGMIDGTKELLGLTDQEAIANVIENSNDWYSWSGTKACQMAKDHVAEMGIAQFLDERIGKSAADASDFDCGEIPESLMSDQKDAFRWAKYFDRIFVITGAPGTGKTHLMKSIIEDRGLRTRLMAPTGKAAQRLATMTGRSASTIHKALGAKHINGKFQFTHNELNPLDAELIVVDEFSMVDTSLAHKLFKAIRPSTQLLLVGDHYQLPSVGPGAVLRDFLAHKAIPTFELTEIKRQDPGAIVTTCHHIKNNEAIVWDELNKNDLWIESSLGNDQVLGSIAQLYLDRMPAWLRKQGLVGDDPVEAMRMIQILSPRRQGHSLDTGEINKLIRGHLIHRGLVQESSWRYGVGDRVIQTKNDYDLGVFNGDMGIVIGLSKDSKSGALCYRVEWDAGSLADRSGIPCKKNDLEFAYAVTIHKSQGSEWPVIISPLSQSFGPFFGRNLIYTGISRASKMFVGVGTFDALCTAAGNTREDSRRTGLLEKLAMLENKVREDVTNG